MLTCGGLGRLVRAWLENGPKWVSLTGGEVFGLKQVGLIKWARLPKVVQLESAETACFRSGPCSKEMD